MASNIDLLTADKLLFAVDLVDYVIIKTRPNFATKTLNILDRVDRLRNFTYNRFDKTIRKALNIIDTNQNNSVYSDFAKMMKAKRIDKESLIEYGNSYVETHFRSGFNAKLFLMFCDRVANMAGYFLSYGVDDAPDIAVDLIMCAFPNTVMYHKSWSKVHKIAKTFVVIGSGYYKDGASSDSSSESGVASSDNEDSSCGSVSTDVNMSSTDETSVENFNVVSSTKRKISQNINVCSNSVSTDVNMSSTDETSVENFGVASVIKYKKPQNINSCSNSATIDVNMTCTDETSSEHFGAASVIKRKIPQNIGTCSNSAGTDDKMSSTDEIFAKTFDVTSAIKCKIPQNINVSSSSADVDVNKIPEFRLEICELLNSRSSDSKNSPVSSCLKNIGNNRSPEEVEMSNNNF